MEFKIGIQDIGSRPHQRWLVRNTVNQYWTGRRWGSEADALVFANVDEATTLAKKMNDRRNRHVPLRKYRVEMTVEVRSHDKIDRETLIDWLQQSTDFQFDWNGHGSGPTDDRIVWATIHWASLRKAR